MNMRSGIIIVDHGSRRPEKQPNARAGGGGVRTPVQRAIRHRQPAHMELAEPSIATAYAHCAERGAERIVVVPFFLGPGKHWTPGYPPPDGRRRHAIPAGRDIVAPTLGIDDLILDLLAKRRAIAKRTNIAASCARERFVAGKRMNYRSRRTIAIDRRDAPLHRDKTNYTTSSRPKWWGDCDIPWGPPWRTRLRERARCDNASAKAEPTECDFRRMDLRP